MSVVKFKSNRVRRNYLGGKELDRLQNIDPAVDSDRPEEWVASLVEASNKGLSDIKNEGLSLTDSGKPFIELINNSPEQMLGQAHYETYGSSLAFLVKLLDSSMRLHTQVHPTREFAKDELNSEWGKFETYYVLKIRDQAEGYIRLGFQHAPTKEEWQEIVEDQDMERMDACFEEIPIQEGDIVYIPGGVPHAIGENVLLVEIMEPSDLVVRCEFEREGIVLPEEGRYMGRDLEFCMDVFDYTQYTIEEIQEKFFLEKELISKKEHLAIHRLIPAAIARTFEVFSFEVAGSSALSLDERFLVGLNLEAPVEIICGETSIIVEQGESFFIPSYATSVQFNTIANQPSELCVISNVL